MSQKKQTDRIIFETSKHHKQMLRSQIDPNLINQIEIDQNPSLNYMNAYKNLYHDQLEKTVQMHEEKRNKQRLLTDQDRSYYTIGMKNQRPPMIDQTNMSASQLSRYGQRYVDYDEEGNLKKIDHVKKNYDGGKNFYKEHDMHLQRQQNQAQLTNHMLQSQLQQKEYRRMKEQQEKNAEIQAFNEMKYRQMMHEEEKQRHDKMGQMALRKQIANQIQFERQKKQRKSIFNYQNVARHNPITNPIEYHIDNPYILKQIQTRNLYKSQSLHQYPRY